MACCLIARLETNVGTSVKTFYGTHLRAIAHMDSRLPFENDHHIWLWRHQMETFTALLALCVSFDVFFDWRLNQAVEQKIDTAAIWDAIVPIMTLL